MRILVIEDDADIASNIGQYCGDKGHRFDFAYSGPPGLKLALEERFDSIILDLMLHPGPVISRQELIDRIWTDEPLTGDPQ